MDQHLAQINGNLNSPNNSFNNSNSSSTGGSSSCQSSDVFTYPSPMPSIIKDTNQNNMIIMKSMMITNNNNNNETDSLNDVIANLTDFTRHETIRQLSLTNGNHSPSPSIGNGIITNGNCSSKYSNSNHEQGNIVNMVKRLASESDNSSSISPSFSERSNGVSWNDQVYSILAPNIIRFFFFKTIQHFLSICMLVMKSCFNILKIFFFFFL